MIDLLASGLTFLPLKFSRNALAHTILPADPALTSRVGLKYKLTILAPEVPQSSTLVELHTSEGREKPPQTFGGVTLLPGAEFRYNSGRNGKIDGLLRFQKPGWRQTMLRVLVEQTTVFQLREDVTGGTPPVATTSTGPVQHAIKGGLSTVDHYAYGDRLLTTEQAIHRRFLTWQPNFKTIAPDQEEYLHFPINFVPTPAQVNLRMRVGEVITTVATTDTPPVYSVLSVPVGPVVCGLADDVLEYEVWLSNESNQRLTESRTYYIDRSYQPWQRHLLFVNSLGGWDTLRLTGKGQETLSVAQNTAIVERSPTADPETPELRIISIEGERSMTVSTGFFRREMERSLRYLDELLLADEVYLVTERGHLPVQLTTSQLTDVSDDPELIARTFSLRLLDTVASYSELPAIAPVPDQPTMWTGRVAQPLVDGFGKRTGYVNYLQLQKVYTADSTPVVPYEVKPNTPGDPDYVSATLDGAITPGTTPFPNTAISRLGTYTRATCAVGYSGSAATITVAASKYGGESAGIAQAMAEAEYSSINTQAYANAGGSCTILPDIFVQLRHKLAMTPDNKSVADPSLYGPLIRITCEGVTYFKNIAGPNPYSAPYQSANKLPVGTRSIKVTPVYVGPTNLKAECQVKLLKTGQTFTSVGTANFTFTNLPVTTGDDPLIFEVTPL